MEKIGFIGLGDIGKPMCCRLINAGYDVTVYARKKEVREEFVRMGALGVSSPREMAEACSMIITMVRNDKETAEIMGGPSGIMGGALDGVLIAIMSTVSPGLCRRLAGEASRKGGSLIDAPVSGSSRNAAEGTLTVMVGGDQRNFERALPVFQKLGTNVFHQGPVGSGQGMKIVNNMVMNMTMFATIEALQLAKAAGMDLDCTREVMGLSSGNSNVLQKWDEWLPRRRATAPEALRKMGYKDIGLGLSLARELNVDMPIASLCMGIDVTDNLERLLG